MGKIITLIIGGTISNKVRDKEYRFPSSGSGSHGRRYLGNDANVQAKEADER